MLLDPEGKRFMVRLNEQDSLHHHRGAVRHADLIGQVEGTVIRSTQGRLFTAVRPRLMDYILAMPRKSGKSCKPLSPGMVTSSRISLISSPCARSSPRASSPLPAVRTR